MERKQERVVEKEEIRLSADDFLNLIRTGKIEEDDLIIRVPENDYLPVISAIK